MIIIPIALSLCLIALDVYMNRKIYSPGVVFNGITFLTLFLYSFQLSYIQQTLTLKTVLFLALCIMWFNIPVFIGYALMLKKQNITLKLKKQEIPFEFKINNKQSKKMDLVLFVIVLSVFIAETIYSRGVPLVWKFFDKEKTYFDFGMPVLHSFFVPFFILVGAYSLFRKKCYYKWFYLSIPILIVSRGFLVAIVIEGFIMWLLTEKKKPKYFWVYLSLAAVAGIVVFGVIGNFRTGKGEFLKVAQFKPQTNWIPSSFKWVYSYICFSISNLNKLINMTGGFVNYGASSFNIIFRPLFLPENKTFNFLVSPNFTVSTFAPSLYLDFGVFGPILFCTLIGLISILIYFMLEKSDILHDGFVLLYTIWLYGIIFLYFDNLFFLRQMYLQIFYVAAFLFAPFLVKWINRRKNIK